MPEYILIVGLGRSGTNWLLDLLDLSPQTHCRNEPNELAHQRSPWCDLPSGWVNRQDADDFEPRWDRAVAWSASRIGERDHHLVAPKQHVHDWGRRLGADRLIKGPKLRRLASLLQPSLAAAEWPMPRWYGDRAKLARAVVVLKLNSVPGWATWVLEHRPRACVVHIVRHPGGYLNSYINRWLNRNDREDVRRRNRQRLEMIAAVDERWAQRLPRIDAMEAEEAELWFWRYANETILAAGDRSEQYRSVVYEQLVAQPVATACRLYRACGLQWDAAMEQAVGATAEDSQTIADAWKHKLSTEHMTLVERILDGSSLANWWN